MTIDAQLVMMMVVQVALVVQLVTSPQMVTAIVTGPKLPARSTISPAAYLLRTRVAQRKLGATLQEPLPPPLNTTRQTTITTCPLLHLQQLLEHLSKTLGFMLSMLPQSLEELEEAMWNDPIQYNFFREDGRVILDVNNCVECYAKDPTVRTSSVCLLTWINTVEHSSPVSYTVEHSSPVSYTVEHSSPVSYTVEHSSPVSYTVEHSSPVSYTVLQLSIRQR
ncbi:hypothetical protein Hamer_G000245 [Homarus americanus]|uniref:Uncharacterized protein n=1 Tax=Homarus americanus TaxID=6706 RepID=A0A8J5NCY4_HOMAM|nr:hypothetical protein Hamer_G000245 [Homarus americanus]